MKILNLIEARRNPSQNEKVGIAQELLKIQAEDENEPLYVHFGNVDRLAINPSANYGGTPLGIYGYPLWYVLDKLELYKGDLPKDVMPYAGDAKHAIVFKNDGEPALLMQNGSECVKKLELFKDKIGPEAYSKIVKYSEEHKSDYYAMKVTSGVASQMLYGATFLHFKVNLGMEGNSSFLPKWTKLLVSLGISGLEDHASKSTLATIHQNEPVQAVFFDVANLSVVASLRNNTNPSAMKKNFRHKGIGEIVGTAHKNRMISNILSFQDFRSISEELMSSSAPAIAEIMNSNSGVLAQADDVHDFSSQIVFRHKTVLMKNRSSQKSIQEFSTKLKSVGFYKLNSVMDVVLRKAVMTLFQYFSKKQDRVASVTAQQIEHLLKLGLGSFLGEEYKKILSEDLHASDIVSFDQSQLSKLKTADDIRDFMSHVKITDENAKAFIEAIGGEEKLSELFANERYGLPYQLRKYVPH